MTSRDLPLKYSVFIADTEEAKQINYRIRHEVYCSQLGYEEEAVNKMEKDDFDKEAIHFIVYCNTLKKWIGSSRLVFRSGRSLPIEYLCNIDNLSADKDLFSPLYCEVSRFCFIKQRERDRVNLFMNLLMVMRKEAKKKGALFSYILIKKGLAKILDRNKVPLRLIGEAVEYRGLRYPYEIDICAFDHIEEKINLDYSLFSEKQMELS